MERLAIYKNHSNLKLMANKVSKNSAIVQAKNLLKQGEKEISGK